MRKVVFVSLLVFFALAGFSQEVKRASVEKSMFGVQAGFLGIWVNHELGITNLIALRSEIGVDAGIWTSGDGTTTILTAPLLAFEPRWYYNINRRESQSKRIDGNSGNFLAIRFRYLFIDNSNSIADQYNLNQPFLAPIWGIRRNISDHFNYEAALGAGIGRGGDEFVLAPYLSLRIGYRI